ncbi:MAG: AraC family transcriptional regulator [Prevotella sp.]|jgi:AraC-like DNA-binding protein|nr:AraC family transcriptional regulator [Prevotella sp.]
MNSILREITPLSEKDCFYITDRIKTEFTYPLHCHDEYELNFVENASGIKRIVGDSAEIIGDYDLVLITSKDLEHAWFQNDCPPKQMREITIQFSSDLFINNFLNKNQFKSINRMFEQARNGICFSNKAIMKVYHMLDVLASEQQGFYSVIKFLSILYELSCYCISEGMYTLSSSSFAKISSHSESRRVQKVQTYIDEHFRHSIRLEDLAHLVGMSPAAFSKFFKLRTGKTLSDYVLDIRIGHTIRLLVDSSMSVSEICYECGFNNISNFNRIFKKKKNCTPSEFRANYPKRKVII